MTTAPDPTERDLTGLLTMAGRALSTRLAAALADAGLTPRLQCVLRYALAEERTQIQLAALTGLDKTTMVSTVDDLERRGLAERRPAPTDRRARIVVVTEQGRLAAEEGQRVVDRVHAEALDVLSAGDRKTFVDVLSRLAGARRDPEPRPGRRVRGS